MLQLMFLPAERFGGGAEYGDLRRASGARRLEAFQVRHQHRVGDTRFLAYAGEDPRVCRPFAATHSGDTKAVASTAGRPASARRSMSSILISVGTCAASF